MIVYLSLATIIICSQGVEWVLKTILTYSFIIVPRWSPVLSRWCNLTSPFFDSLRFFFSKVTLICSPLITCPLIGCLSFTWWHCLLQDDWLHFPSRWHYSFPSDHLSFFWLPILYLVTLPAPRWLTPHPFEVTLFISLWSPVLSLTACPLLGNAACSKMTDYTSLQGDAIHFPLITCLYLETLIYLRLFVVSKENEGYHGCSRSNKYLFINSW